MAVSPIPQGFHTLTPYLVVRDARRLLDFVQKAFGAEVLDVMPTPDGGVGHAQVRIGDSMLMMGTAHESSTLFTTMLYLYVDDCDAWFHRALAAGAKVVRGLADQFYGDRHGGVEDEFGNQWWVATRKEDLSSDEIRRRAAKAHGGDC
ncbi:MAG: VOC family protein [Planctomycetota bacterium]